jgi:hypothetical protein
MLRRLGRVFAANFFLGFSLVNIGLVVFTMVHGLALYAFIHSVMGAISGMHHVQHMSTPLDDIEDRYVADAFE